MRKCAIVGCWNFAPNRGGLCAAHRVKRAVESETNLTCQQCGKRLSKKTARLIEGRTLCSSCMFRPPARHGVEFSDEGRG